MKKSLKTVFAAVMASAMLFTFASCAEEEEEKDSSNLPASVGINTLAGNSFNCMTPPSGATIELSFTKNTYTLTKTTARTGVDGVYEDFDVKAVCTYKYTYDADTGVVYSTLTDKKDVCVRGDKTLYTFYYSKLPATAAAYMNFLLEESKAFVLDSVKDSLTINMVKAYRGNEIYSTFKKYGYTDSTGAADVSEEIYSKWYKVHKAEYEYHLREIKVTPYSFSGSTLKARDNFHQYPDGLKFGDLFNGTYSFWSNNGHIIISEDSWSGREYFILDEATGTSYKILSAKNDSLVIIPIEKDAAGVLYVTPNGSQKITVPVTYTPGTNKTTAAITIGENTIEFDINYFTKDTIDSVLYSSCTVYDKQTPVM